MFSSIDVFWDLYPFISALGYGSFERNRDDAEYWRRRCIEDGTGSIIKYGIGYEYLDYYPFLIEEEAVLEGHHVPYVSANWIFASDFYFFFLEWCLAWGEPTSPQVSLDDTYVSPGSIEPGDSPMTMKMTVGFGKSF